MKSQCALTDGTEVSAAVQQDAYPTGVRYTLIQPVSGLKPLTGSSMVMRHDNMTTCDRVSC